LVNKIQNKQVMLLCCICGYWMRQIQRD